MTSATDESVRCPNCGSPYINETNTGWKCRSCGFDGVMQSFNPMLDDDSPAVAARLEDAVCANHPGKKAVTICSGTGDYICSLCRVTIHGHDYSVQYLDRGGRLLAGQTFSQYLPRPDRLIVIMLYLSIPFMFMAPVLFVYSCICLARAYRMRREDQVYAKVMSPIRMWFHWGLQLIVALFMLWLYLMGIIGVINEA